MNGNTWAGVRERVLRFAEHPAAEAVFGARGHGFRLGPVMDGEQLRTVWEDLRPMDRGIEPTGHDFAHWYRSWLSRTEHECAITPPPAPHSRDTP
ncbi:hypothetical protein AB0G42_33160 [Streptomyces yangpuensis]|uniref:hypothetical protein n=1 Tax=Streptomyces yangpuensis TaxID=1648182 RepID=UPI0034416C51